MKATDGDLFADGSVHVSMRSFKKRMKWAGNWEVVLVVMLHIRNYSPDFV